MRFVLTATLLSVLLTHSQLPASTPSTPLQALSPGEMIPLASELPTERGVYHLVQGDPSHEVALSGLTALLEYYDDNLEDLKVEYQRREALTAARKRYDAANSEELEPFLIQFWIPESTDKETEE